MGTRMPFKSHHCKSRVKKTFLFFFMVNFIYRLLKEQRIHDYFLDQVMSNANDRAAISNCSIMFLKRFYRLKKRKVKHASKDP